MAGAVPPDRGFRLGHTQVLPADVLVTRDADGTIRARSPHALGSYPDRITDRLNHWAAVAPDRTFLAARGPDRAWRHLTYGQAQRRVRSVAETLLTRGLSRDRTIVILSGNS